MHLLRLEDNGEFGLTEFVGRNIPSYAILSHTWGPDAEELRFDDIVHGTGKEKAGYKKIRFCQEQASRDALQYFWVDTCCINKTNSTELNEAITSMFRWYQNAAKCYAYLSDVSVTKPSADGQSEPNEWELAFRKSRWFTRGWTLQELIAPISVTFFSVEGDRLGDKASLGSVIHEVTRIPAQILAGSQTNQANIDEKLSWAANRETRREEDAAYCLQGLFDVSMVPIYGEGREKAFMRLGREIKDCLGIDPKAMPAELLPKSSNLSVAQKKPNSIFMVPFSKDASFVGREGTLTRIDEKILRDETRAQDHIRAALVGLGGVGKSQIAIEYAYRIQKLEPSTHVFWIHASNAARFEQGYRSIAKRAKLPGLDDPEIDVLQLVSEWLASTEGGQWLMILDNVDDDAVFFSTDNRPSESARSSEAIDDRPLEMFIPQTANGCILLTSRNNEAASNLIGSHENIIPVMPMAEPEALSLLRTRVTVSEKDEADAKELVKALDYMPLAISHAGAFIRTRMPQTTISSYLQLFRQSEANQTRLLQYGDRKDLRRDHTLRYPVMTTWQISFEQIQKTLPAAAELLALMSMLDRQGIPVSLVQQGRDQIDFDDALTPLLGFSLVHIDSTGQALNMHRLVQLSMRAWLKANGKLGKMKWMSIKVVQENFPTGEYGTWNTCQLLFPHATEILQHTVDEDAVLMHQVAIAARTGKYLFEQGEYDAAQKLWQKMLQTADVVLGRDNAHTIIIVVELGRVLLKQGKYKEAEVEQRRAYEASVKAYGPNHLNTLDIIHELGRVLSKQGRDTEAEVMFRRALEGSEEVLDPDDTHVLTTIHELGKVLSTLGKYDEAEDALRRALHGSEKTLGPEHVDTLASMSILGYVLMRRRKFTEAEVLLRRALEGYENAIGLEHPTTLWTVYTLAMLFHHKAQYEASLGLYQRASTGFRLKLGVAHPTTLLCEKEMADMIYAKEMADMSYVMRSSSA